MNYELRNKQVDAYQLEDFNGATRELPPRWVIAKILDGSFKIEADTRSIRFLNFLVNPGDWIIKTSGGQIFALADQHFQTQYELIPQVPSQVLTE